MSLLCLLLALVGVCWSFEGLNKSDAEILVDVTQAEANLVYIKNSFPEWWLFCPVIKGDAYGHGIEVFSRLAGYLNLGRVCVVENWEAAVVRHDSLNPSAEDLEVLRVRSASADDYFYTVNLDIQEAVGSWDNVNDIVQAMKVFQEEEAHAFPTVKLHVNIDTSMIAYDGFSLDWNDEVNTPSMQVQQILDRIEASYPAFFVSGFMTHLGLAYKEKDLEYLILEFLSAVCPIAEHMAASRPEPVVIHFASTASFLMMHERGRIECSNVTGNPRHPNLQYMMRIGSGIYGLKSQDQLAMNAAKPLVPLMTVQAKLRSVHYAKQGRLLGHGVSSFAFDGQTLTRDSVVGTISVGWLDGYPTPIKNTGDLNASTDGRVVVFDSTRSWFCTCPIMKNPNMNMIAIDLTDCEYFASRINTLIDKNALPLGDLVVELFGSHGVDVNRVALTTNDNAVWIATMMGKNRDSDTSIQFVCKEGTCKDISTEETTIHNKVTFLESLSTPGKVKLLLIFFGVSIFLFLCAAFGLLHVYLKQHGEAAGLGALLADPNYTPEPSREKGQYTRI